MSGLPSDTLLGELHLVETYEFYDRPLLFSCRNAADQFFLVLLVEEEEHYDKWLLVPISHGRLLDVRVGEEDLALAFGRPESGHAWLLTDFRGERHSDLISASTEEIDEAWLPDKGETLNRREPFQVREVSRPRQRAAASRRDALDIKLYFPGISNTGRAPLVGVGNIFTEFQLSVDALGTAAATQALAQGKRFKRRRVRSAETELLVESTFRSSFGVQITAASYGDLLGHSVLADALRMLFSLVDAKADEGLLREVLKPAGAHAAHRYSRFLSVMADRGVSFALEWASPYTTESRSSGLNSEEARAAVQVIERAEMKKSVLETVVGTLVGLNRRTRVFELWLDEEKVQLAGKVSVRALPSVDGAIIGERYIASVEENVEGKDLLDEERITFTLLELRPLTTPSVP